MDMGRQHFCLNPLTPSVKSCSNWPEILSIASFIYLFIFEISYFMLQFCITVERYYINENNLFLKICHSSLFTKNVPKQCLRLQPHVWRDHICENYSQNISHYLLRYDIKRDKKFLKIKSFFASKLLFFAVYRICVAVAGGNFAPPMGGYSSTVKNRRKWASVFRRVGLKGQAAGTRGGNHRT